MDPVSTKYRGPGRYLDYDETWQTSPTQPIMPQDAGAALAEAAGYEFKLILIPDKWGIRLDATASIIFVGIDINLEIACPFGELTDCSTAGAIGPEFGSVGVQGAVGPVLAIEDSTKESRTISTVGGSLTILGGAEADVSWADGFLEVFAGYSGGDAGGIYIDPASVPFDSQEALTFIVDLVSELAGVWK